MHVLTRACATIVATLCALTLLGGVAAASRGLQFEPGGSITKVTSDFRITQTLRSITCHVTFSGTLTREVILKSSQGRLPGANVGQISRTTVEECREQGGLPVAVRIPTPVELRYEGFLGALPNISGLLFAKLSFAIEVASCLYTGNPGLLIAFPAEESGGTRFNRESWLPNTLTLLRGERCNLNAEVGGTGQVTPAQRLRLVA